MFSRRSTVFSFIALLSVFLLLFPFTTSLSHSPSLSDSDSDQRGRGQVVNNTVDDKTDTGVDDGDDEDGDAERMWEKQKKALSWFQSMSSFMEILRNSFGFETLTPENPSRKQMIGMPSFMKRSTIEPHKLVQTTRSSFKTKSKVTSQVKGDTDCLFGVLLLLNGTTPFCFCPNDFVGETCQFWKNASCSLPVSEPKSNCEPHPGFSVCVKRRSDESDTFASIMNCTFEAVPEDVQNTTYGQKVGNITLTESSIVEFVKNGTFVNLEFGFSAGQVMELKDVALRFKYFVIANGTSKNDTSAFMLSVDPRTKVEVAPFDGVHIGDNDHTLSLQLNSSHWDGTAKIELGPMDYGKLPDSFKSHGLIYLEMGFPYIGGTEGEHASLIPDRVKRFARMEVLLLDHLEPLPTFVFSWWLIALIAGICMITWTVWVACVLIHYRTRVEESKELIDLMERKMR
eukprot:TRINITY_DN236_c0_g1_i1.p1 TRINITY_DN236_c0_g1~~TRINITY_DN236_c0_g1_i1.p1  ORF type:complete len:456 (-),score=115.02 TRINITY_DN236_c0_g1_i1:1024-2391(-)